MTTSKTLKILTILLGLFLTSCDPTYPILITNSRTDTITVLTETTIHFHFDDTLTVFKDRGGPFDHKIIELKMAPGTSIECGMAIAGIQDEMPFTKLKVYSGKDTVDAESQDKILDLFEKTFLGNLKTPYVLTIK